MKTQRPYPALTITPKGEAALTGGHPWVYEGEVTAADGGPEDGALVDVVSRRGSWLGCGFYNSRSKIRVRLVSRNANDDFSDAFWERRIRYAWDYRKVVMGETDSRCCRVIGLKDQCFGVEVEMTGITREQAATALAAYFATDARYVGGAYDKWCVTDRDGKEWTVMSDSSIHGEQKIGSGYRATGDYRYRVEMVTPKLTYAELPKLQECVRQVRHAGAKANSSCGIHVHVDAANHNRQSLKNLIGIMYSKEDILFKALQVNESRASRWCQKVREPMLKQARRLSSDETRDLTQLENIWYEGDNGSADHYNWTRYYALNLHSVFYRGTVEWRCFNSTLHAGKVAAYVNLCLAISAQAIAQRSTVMRKTHSDNELFTFRVWLVRLGLNGEEFKHTRDHLLANLDGDRAWRFDKDSYAVNQKKKKSREMER